MSILDWGTLLLTILAVIVYGIYKGKETKDIDAYYRSGRQLPWYMVMLSVIGTQASAITFLSGPGQAYTDGMRFLQYYFGLPLAMIVLCITFVPIFHKLNIYTAYEFLEKRFDKKTRTLAALLFMFSRALATGLSVYAPAIILSTVLGWNIYLMNVVMGGIVILYSISGGAKAIAYTQQLQLIIIFSGLFFAAFLLVSMLPANMAFMDAIHVGRLMGKMNVITTGITEKGFNWNDRFNIFSGVIGGFFLALSYFGTDQSQVGRYLTASSVRQSRLGLLMNGLVKVPMQYFILLIGVLVFVFYQFNETPLYFNKVALNKLKETEYRNEVLALEKEHAMLNAAKFELKKTQTDYTSESNVKALMEINTRENILREEVKALVKKSKIQVEASDTNYIFIGFVLERMPHGLIGLLIAVIFLASWGSNASSLNALSSSSLIDIHKQYTQTPITTEREFKLSRIYTMIWGVFCILFAEFATNLGSLIEAVNILGSWFYGVMLGIFLVAFYVKKVGGHAVFIAAIIGELIVIGMYLYTDIGWLWLNVIGAIAVILLSMLIQFIIIQRVPFLLASKRSYE